jgi:hypothetical protein
VNIAPFHSDPRVLALLAMFAITAASLAVGLALRRFLSRWLPEDDPRRQLIAQAMLYGGTFVVRGVCMASPPLKVKKRACYAIRPSCRTYPRARDKR